MTQAVELEEGRERSLVWLKWLCVAFIAVCIIVAVVATPGSIWLATGKEPATAGEFGDMFGASNALFSGLAFLGVVVAILLQSQELALQREELKSTRQVLSDQRNEMKTQNAALAKQQFQSMFFQMVSLHNQIVNDLDTTYDTVRSRGFQSGRGLRGGFTPAVTTATTVRGRDVFPVFFKNFKSIVHNNLEIVDTQADCAGSDAQQNARRAFSIAFSMFYEKHSGDLGHYFRNLYTIVKYADKHGGVNSQDYINILRAQLSSFELALLFYNCTCGQGISRFLPLVEKYAFFEHMQIELLFDSDHLEWIDHTAFEEAVRVD
ncbi:putative phage abortive infection protein [Roseimaritima ulvae]|uniref:Phage abortive infection protein n=2 Tax=Roseimaritima ulvae TaxID=980254 RepID=A0A5B9QKH9_9BACT|nr:putative phage abortive infection protein [Roseimaritima ulvae]QEG39384.1 hypothetical protein UC8_13610 [Roseimaritima ulvae]